MPPLSYQFQFACQLKGGHPLVRLNRFVVIVTTQYDHNRLELVIYGSAQGDGPLDILVPAGQAKPLCRISVDPAWGPTARNRRAASSKTGVSFLKNWEVLRRAGMGMVAAQATLTSTSSYGPIICTSASQRLALTPLFNSLKEGSDSHRLSAFGSFAHLR